MDKTLVIKKTVAYVRRTLIGEVTGHDLWHVDRVRRNALAIAKKEGGDKFIIELAALLHDIAYWKFHDGDEKASSRTARMWLEKCKVLEKITSRVCEIADTISFKGAGVKDEMRTLEGNIVQDADRVDAMGAIGVARAFAYGGFKGRELHNPEIKAAFAKSFDVYKKGAGTTINHFYEKLLLLKDRMNTETGRRTAAERHEFLEEFLEKFLAEWNI